MIVAANNLKRQHDSLRNELNEALWRVIDNSSFILGPEVNALEKRFAEYSGVDYAIGVASGTAALYLPLLALGIGSGDEVIVPAMTFFATAEAVALTGARPVFVDIDPVDFTIDRCKIERCITKHTKAIYPVHLYGHPANMREITAIAQSYKIDIVEDCAHAPGATQSEKKTGSFGTFGAFSFYPCKNLGAIGEAGMITTNNETLANLCRMYRDHGSVEKFKHNLIGTNNRLDGIQAAVLSVKLPHLDMWNKRRNQIGKMYNQLLGSIDAQLPYEEEHSFHVFHVYQMLIDNRDELYHKLQKEGIGVNLHYPVPMHLHPAFEKLGYKKGDFPVAENLAQKTISLPCYPELTDEEIVFVSDTIIKCL
jgi:dTDP-4-amino-4,6-dideoxygalactose transaminase